MKKYNSDEHENAEDHGHLPAHEVRKVVETSLCLLQQAMRGKAQVCCIQPWFFAQFIMC
jgi:hypothetical protein